MKEITLADQVMESLAFEVEEVPQDGQISSVSSNSPLNVKIRIRKKNKKQLQDGGIISIPKIDNAVYDSEKIRATSSDQTIMSFNVLMDRGQFIKKRPPKQKRIMQLFKRGGCLGIQNDEDQYEYSIRTSQLAVRENELPKTTEGLSSDSPNKPNFALAKNYSNTEALQANKHKNTDFLGKCKPGGCLDPPFGEDKYSYLPKFINVSVADQTKTNECECKDTLNPNNIKNESNDQDKISCSSVAKTEKTKSVCKPCDSKVSLLQVKNSNSIITFPSISSPSEALNKLQIQRRSKSYSGSRESRSYSESNQLLETYYISPKIKTLDQRPKSITGSIDTGNIDIPTIKSKEKLLGETKCETHVNSELGINKNLENAEKTPLHLTNKEIIPNNILNDFTRGDEHTLLKERSNDLESTGRDKSSIINVMTETSPLIINGIVSNPDMKGLYLTNKENIPNNIINDDTPADKPTLLKERANDVESTEKDKSSIINVVIETSPLIINDIVSNHDMKGLYLTNKEIIPNIIINDDTPADKPTLLKERANDVESTERDKSSINNVITETSPLNINGVVSTPDILLNKQKIESDKECLVKEDTIQIAILQEIPTKSLENVSLKTENGTETITSSMSHDFILDKTGLKSITEPLKNPLNEIVQGPIGPVAKSESDDFKNKTDMEIISLQQDHATHNESINVIDVNTKIPLEEINQPIIKMLTKSVESIVTKKTSAEIMMASTEHQFYINDEPFIKYDAPKISSPKENQKDVSNSDIISLTNNINDGGTMDKDSINTKFVLQKSSSIINEDLTTIKDAMGVASPAESLSFKEVRGSTKNEKNVEAVVSGQGPLHDVEAFQIIETDASTLFQEADQDMTLLSKSSKDKIRELIDEHSIKLEEYVEDINKIETKSSAEVVPYEELKNNAVDSTSLISYNENKNVPNDSNSITTNLNFQDDIEDKDGEKLESFHTIKSNLIKPDQVLSRGNQDASVTNSVINAEEASDVHVDVYSVIGNVISNENSITKSQKVEDSIKFKTGILHDENYHKDLEVTFNDKIISERLDTSNILSKPMDGVKIPMDAEFYQLSNDVWNSKENFNKTATFSSNNVAFRNEGDKTLNHLLSENYDAKEIIHLNMAFQSFQTQEDGSVIRTLNFSSFSDSKRYPNDNILQFKTIIRPNDGEIKIPIDSEKDLVLQITTDQKYKDQRDGLIKTSPYFNKQKGSKHKSNVINEGSDGGSLFPSDDSASKDTPIVTKNPLDGIKSNDTNLQQTLDDVYKDKLLPLHDIIKKLKSDIDELSKQQTLIKERMHNAKRVQSNPIYTSSKKCGCIEMLFRR